MAKNSARVALAALVLAVGAEAFAPQSSRAHTLSGASKSLSLQPKPLHSNDCRADNVYRLYSSPQDGESCDNKCIKDDNSYRHRLQTILHRKYKPVTSAAVTAASLLSCLPGQYLFKPPAAQASAPIVLREKLAKDDPPMVQAMTKAKDLKKKRSMEEFDAFMQKCNDIEDAQGKKARYAYEKQYNADKAAKAAQKVIDLEKLKRDLLDEGKDPFTYLDAEREVFLFEHDVDLAKIPGTPHNEQLIKEFRSRGKNLPTYDNQIYIVKCQVADLKTRGVDPLEHFAQQEVNDKTRAIYYKMKDAEAAKVAEQYKALMEEYGGRLTPANEGEVPFVKFGTTTAVVAPPTADASKEQLAAEKAAAKQKRAAEKAAAKAKRAAEKEAAKKEKEAQKQARAEEKARIKTANLEEKQKAKDEASKIATASSPAHMASDSEIAATAGMDFAATAGQEAGSHSFVEKSSHETSTGKDIMSTIKEHATKGNIAKAVIIGGVASYGINYVKENNPATKAERQRQLDLLMGVDNDDDDDDEEMDLDGDDVDFSPDQEVKVDAPPAVEDKPAPPPAPKAEAPTPKKKKSPVPAAEPPKPKKKFGFFKKKSTNDRETDINALISADAEAPEFASLLAKILTFGAPGRFPAIANIGDMPFDKFDLENAKEMLIETRSYLDMSDEKSAEVFANVVNCMIIDIVDLASGALKAKEADDKLAIDAINVVMDFCDHAASLFDAVAKDVEIKPVTYGGTLRKKDLEQMFSKYAGSSMMSIIGGGSSQDRVDTLQIILGISDKKAEGLMQKHMMKMMMNLMKDGGKGLEGMPGMEGMEEMMKAMGGEGGMEEMMKAMGGMEGMLPGTDGEMNPEDLKQTVTMMKELMDSGQVSKEELADIRKQFKDMYGSDIGELIKQADQAGAGAGMGEDEKELLDMFKRILDE